MVQATKERALNWLAVDNEQVDVGLIGPLVWEEVHGDDLPIGIDYFVFACTCAIDQSTVARWLRNLLGLSTLGLLNQQVIDLLLIYDKQVLISGLEMLWRRRLKSLASWLDEGQRQTNHVNRVKHRAMKLLEEEASAGKQTKCS